MTLSEKQKHFTFMLARLIAWVYANNKNQNSPIYGYEVVLGEVHRPEEMAKIYARKGKGIENSRHIQKLAGDLHLFIHGVYQADSEAHRPIGEKWESFDSANVWGGEFSRPDGNHYEYAG